MKKKRHGKWTQEKLKSQSRTNVYKNWKGNSSIMMKKRLELERFGINRLSADNKLISFHTGFSSYKVFLT